MALELDARQRAMLEEMHVRVWWPQAPAAVEQPTPQAVPAAAAISEPISAPIPAPVPAPAVVARATPAVAPPAPAPQPARPAVAPADDGRAAAIAAMDWPALQQSVAGCEACKLCGTRKNTVFGVGPTAPQADAPPRVDWLIVGEAPGEQEDLRGEPFVGQAGKLLDNMLRAVGVSRHGEVRGAQAAFIVNVLKCRPPGNRNPALDEVAQCEPFLKRQIALLQPRIILAVGRFAVQSLLAGSVPDVQTQPLGRLRGKVYRYEGVPVVVSYHPAYLLRSLPEKAKAWADLCLAMETVKAVESP
ncbi:uracil-DNA glycosylase family protein [Pseudorhodoferax sp. Leaf274]|uniref:uracil-DNA glycosylase n=1 Tax=Pseudorhodoferax sp. Leaf274 TaxID=1736318 RepID=UPI00070386C7|nr:uracil-DNA glycosylase [Pseudorhodoferax sp. Leaf274]KQP49768.1 DNA polymerase [Pseudorhodoferax sp. Leaf274]